MTDPNYTHLALIVDRSGSMQSIAGDMNGAIRALLEEQAKQPGELRVDVWTFDGTVEHRFSYAKPELITDDLVEPRGNTALNDAVGQAIVALGAGFAGMDESDRPAAVIVAIVTDGQENSSKEYKLDQVKQMIETQTNDYGWKFVFFGTEDIDVVTMAAGYGVPQASTMSYARSAKGASDFGVVASSYLTSQRLGEDVDLDEVTGASTS
jgi:uncharacterized protein YegL